jgi:hypothetical protein
MTGSGAPPDCGRPSTEPAMRQSSRGRSSEVMPMWDFIVVAIGIVAFGLFYAYALGCERL